MTAYKISRDDGYANVARDIIQYVARDLQHPAGGFYSAEDADSYPEEDPSKKMGRFCSLANNFALDTHPTL